tara:strand:- start:592 stop:888 length:297 start_codon:yes stop_codon:yes gene_type:complete
MVAKKTGKDYDMVEVLWIDAEEHGEIGWNNLKAQLKYAKKPCPLMRSIGFEVWRDAKHIALISSIGDKECSSVEKIPIGFIESITKLSRGKSVKLTSE